MVSALRRGQRYAILFKGVRVGWQLTKGRRAGMDDCRYFVDQDGSYWEEDGIILQRWPKPMVTDRDQGTGYDECFCDGCYFGSPCEVKL